MNIFLILECKDGIDIEKNGEYEEEKLFFVSIGNENLDCFDKGNLILIL